MKGEIFKAIGPLFYQLSPYVTNNEKRIMVLVGLPEEPWDT